MGSTGGVFRKDFWKIDKRDTFKHFDGNAVHVIIGEIEDYGVSDVTQWMNEKVFDKIMRNEYTVQKLHWSEEIPIKVFNEKGQEIDIMNDQIAEYVSCETCKYLEKDESIRHIQCMHIKACQKPSFDNYKTKQLRSLRWSYADKMPKEERKVKSMSNKKALFAEKRFLYIHQAELADFLTDLFDEHVKIDVDDYGDWVAFFSNGESKGSCDMLPKIGEALGVNVGATYVDGEGVVWFEIKDSEQFTIAVIKGGLLQSSHTNVNGLKQYLLDYDNLSATEDEKEHAEASRLETLIETGSLKTIW